MSDKQPYADSYQEGDEYVARMHMPRSFINDLSSTPVLFDRIVSGLTQKFIDEKGGEILKAITPDQVKKAIEQEVARKFFKEDR